MSRRNVPNPKNRTHGMSGSSEYKSWSCMIQRCHNPNYSFYYDYGGRGISVCPSWRESFEAFFQHVGPKPSAEHSIDRIDNNGNYEPGNVRWATLIEQRNNKRSNRVIVAFGKSKTVAEWAREYGMSWDVLWARVKQGWKPEKALTAALRPPRLVSAFGREQSIAEWAKEVGLSWKVLGHRINVGWDAERAISTPVGKHTKRAG